jgi:hypothetical protein
VESNGRPVYPSASVPHVDDFCARCGGLMVLEHYMDLQDDTGQIGMTALRCTSCGEVVDPFILQNRFKPAPNLLYGTKQRKYAQRVDQGESDGSTDQDDNGSGAGQRGLSRYRNRGCGPGKETKRCILS